MRGIIIIIFNFNGHLCQGRVIPPKKKTHSSSFQKCADVASRCPTATSTTLLQSAGTALPTPRTQVQLTSFPKALHKGYLGHTPTCPLKNHLFPFSQACWMLKTL